MHTAHADVYLPLHTRTHALTLTLGIGAHACVLLVYRSSHTRRRAFASGAKVRSRIGMGTVAGRGTRRRRRQVGRLVGRFRGDGLSEVGTDEAKKRLRVEAVKLS